MGKELFFPWCLQKLCRLDLSKVTQKKYLCFSYYFYLFFLPLFLLFITFFARSKNSLHSKYCITAIFTFYATCTFISFKSLCLILFRPQPLLLFSSAFSPLFFFSFTSVRSRDRPLQKSLCPCMSARCGLSQCIYHNDRELFIYGQLVCPWRYKRLMVWLY